MEKTVLWISAEIIHDGDSRRSKSIFECREEETIADLYARFHNRDDSQTNITARIFNSRTPLEKHNVPLHAPLTLLKEFSANSVQFQCEQETPEKVQVASTKKNAFDIMMTKTKQLCLPERKNEERLASDKLYNDILDFFSEKNVGWSASIVETVGGKFAKLLTDILWHITCHFDFFAQRGAKLEDVWGIFANRHDYKRQRQAKPTLSSEKLDDFTTKLSDVLNSPWMNSSVFLNLRTDVSSLNRSLVKVYNYMKSQNATVTEKRHESEPARISTDSTSLKHINYCQGPLRREYYKLSVDLESRDYYEPILLCDFEPDDRRQRYYWLEGLSLPVSVALLRRAYGGNIGTMNFLWKVPVSEEERDDTTEMRVVLDINNNLPKFHSRQMEKDFIKRYSEIVKTPVSVLRSIYREISGDSREYENEHEKERSLRIAKFITACDSSDIILDLRKLNGRPNSTKFDPFWDEIHAIFNEYQASVQERRQDNVLYLPFAISVRELVDRVKERKPDVDVPSLEWVRLQFTPSNPYSNNSMKYTARFEIRFMVQRRQMRYDHPDSKYAQMTYKYLKEFAIMHKETSRIVFLDDKAVIPVGKPGLPVSTNVRRHNRSLGPVSGAILGAADHDWNVAGIVSSVTLCSEIPDSISDSFFNGKVMVTSKDRVFEASTPMRHARELANVLQSSYSSNAEKLDEPVLLMYTDGGGDHNVTHASVQLSLLCLFIELNLDMLIAVRTCPTQSWVNPAERCMYLLNLALQNVALERDTMEVGFENLIRNKTNMKEIRDKAKRNEFLETEFVNAMKSPINIVNERYQKMCLKHEYIQTYNSTSKVTIESVAKLMEEIDSSVNPFTATKASLLSAAEYQDFFNSHCNASTYVFQVKKCTASNCRFCSSHPVRMDLVDFASLHFLPFPMLDSTKEHFKNFVDVYGKKTVETDRPSLNLKMATTEQDVKFKSQLVAIKVRCTINCIDCEKPRCIYSGKSLSVSESTAIQIVRDEDMYICGSSLFSESHPLYDKVIVRTTLSCEMPVETTYFGATTVKLKDVCNHCGGSSGAPFVNDDAFNELKKQYTRVRSYCTMCKRLGKEPTTWGAMTASAKKKKKV